MIVKIYRFFTTTLDLGTTENHGRKIKMLIVALWPLNKKKKKKTKRSRARDTNATNSLANIVSVDSHVCHCSSVICSGLSFDLSCIWS